MLILRSLSIEFELMVRVNLIPSLLIQRGLFSEVGTDFRNFFFINIYRVDILVVYFFNKKSHFFRRQKKIQNVYIR